MINIKGKFNEAKVFAREIDDTTQEQVEQLCAQAFIAGSNIRIMPDCHAGMGCVIGTTMTIRDKVVPNLVGVDIGCGLIVTELFEKSSQAKPVLDFARLDDYIRRQIPCGFANNKKAQADGMALIESLRCLSAIKKPAKDFNLALGSLGSGNHFIEVNIGATGTQYLVIHSGSRNLGHQVASYYQKLAVNYHKARSDLSRDLCYLEGELLEDYLHDMAVAQEYASLNRQTMARRIVTEALGLDYQQLEKFETVHNYIDLEHNILRKGAISARQGEKVIIPINMRDGSIIAVGKGNPDWNYSAPHGAGRLLSRTAAKQAVNIDDFAASMSQVWTTSVCKSTLDEAPMVYKPLDTILTAITDTVDVLEIVKPRYNFKAN